MFNLVCLPQAHLAAVNPRVGGHATKVENIKKKHLDNKILFVAALARHLQHHESRILKKNDNPLKAAVLPLVLVLDPPSKVIPKMRYPKAMSYRFKNSVTNVVFGAEKMALKFFGVITRWRCFRLSKIEN